MFCRSCMLQAATNTKSHGTLSTLTLAPLDCGLRPVMGNFLSCMAVRMNLWRFPRWEISSTNRTPSWASWMDPGMTLWYAGTPILSCPP